MTGAPAEYAAAPVAPELEVPGEPDSDKVYLGAVKSYNDRRGFGFVACAETAADFGRDVYMAKLEAQMAAANIRVKSGEDLQKAAERIAEQLSVLACGDKPGTAPRLAEEDLVQFMVKLSVEGFPQAVQVQRLRKYTGTVTRSPEWQNESPNSPWKPGCVTCEEVAKAYGGLGEVTMPQEACGQVRLVPGDRVTFCLPEELEGKRCASANFEAKLVMLAQSQRPSGSVLGCCKIRLPRPAPNGEGKPQPAPLSLDCHAFNSKVVLSGLSIDVGESELMRFFSKQGASKAMVAHARGCSFASITFPSSQEVSTFLGRCAHAFADDKETRIATLHNHAPKKHGPNGHCLEEARLPALPAPNQCPGEEPASILVNWAPLQLAIGYVVELRPAGTKADWAPVDVTAGRLGAEAGRFGPTTSSCKVSGLRPGFAYEARVTYFSSCGCRSEASDASQPCAPCGEQGRGASGPATNQAPAGGNAWPEVPGPHPMAMMQGVQPGPNYCPPPPAAPAGYAQTLHGPGWRCGHGTIVPPPPSPEVLAGDEAGFSVAVRWPSVGHAAAYVVELREAGSPTVERFVRSAPSAAPGSLVELRVGGLRPVPGRTYVAQVRCVAHCGCESAPSAPGCSPPMGCAMPPPDMATGVAMAGTVPAMAAPPMHHPAPAGYGNLHTPPPPQWVPATGVPEGHPQPPAATPNTLQMPAGFAYANGGWAPGYSGPLPDASPLSVHFAPSPAADGVPPGTAEAALAAALKDHDSPATVHAPPPPRTKPSEVPLCMPMGHSTAGAPLVPPPDAPPGATKIGRKDQILPFSEKQVAQRELPPEVTGQEECLILD